MHHVGIIGYPLGHSISPVFQQAAFDYHKLDARYERWETPEDQLKPRVESLRLEQNWGANVTVPYKERVIPFLDGLRGDAAAINAVNVIFKEGGSLLGTNTDVDGFLHALEVDGQFDPRGKCVVVVGAGGVARAVVYGLLKAGAASVTVANRGAERSQKLLSDLRRFASIGQEAAAVTLDKKSVAPLLRDCNLLVNCTSLGMKGSQEKETPLSKDLIPPGALVYDLVYNPTETVFLKQATAAGARTLGGLPMLVYQGAASFELWTGRKAPIDIMFEAARQALR